MERGYDRWAYAHHHMRKAAAQRRGVKAAWQRQELAWTNYWQLQEELNALTRTDSSGRS